MTNWAITCDQVVAALTERWRLKDERCSASVDARLVAVDLGGERVSIRHFVRDAGSRDGKRLAYLVDSAYLAWRAQYTSYLDGAIPWSAMGAFEANLPRGMAPERPAEVRRDFFFSVLWYEATFGRSPDRARARLHGGKPIG